MMPLHHDVVLRIRIEPSAAPIQPVQRSLGDRIARAYAGFMVMAIKVVVGAVAGMALVFLLWFVFMLFTLPN